MHCLSFACEISNRSNDSLSISPACCNVVQKILYTCVHMDFAVWGLRAIFSHKKLSDEKLSSKYGHAEWDHTIRCRWSFVFWFTITLWRVHRSGPRVRPKWNDILSYTNGKIRRFFFSKTNCFFSNLGKSFFFFCENTVSVFFVKNILSRNYPGESIAFCNSHLNVHLSVVVLTVNTQQLPRIFVTRKLFFSRRRT